MNEYFYMKLPMPPTVNKMKLPIVRRAKYGKSYTTMVNSALAKTYWAEIEKWKLMNMSTDKFYIAKEMLDRNLLDGKLIYVNKTFFWHYDKIYTLKGKPKRIDVDNRIKPTHDAIAMIMGFDDKLIFDESSHKDYVVNEVEQCVVCRIEFTEEEKPKGNIIYMKDYIGYN